MTAIRNLKLLPDWPGMLSEDNAAAYVDLGLPAFRRAVGSGELPRPRLLAGEKRWSRCEIDRQFDPLGHALGADAFDPIAAAIDAM